MVAIFTSALERSLRVGIHQEWLKTLLLGVIDKYARKEGSSQRRSDMVDLLWVVAPN